MNKVLAISVFLFLHAGHGFSQSYQPENTVYNGVKFEGDLSWSQVKEKAKAENEYIFVDVYATWCGPCKMMDKQVYLDSALGNEMNRKFISVKVQIDSTIQDNQQTKAWYADAHNFLKEYRIHGFPSFLFFTPDGKWIYKDIGFKNVAEFTAIEKSATDPRTAEYYTQMENYNKGIKDYPTMAGLAIFVKKLIDDQQLAKTLAKDCKENYLDRLTEEELCTKENLDFIGEFYNLINSKDGFFDLCFRQPDRVDHIKDLPGWAKFLVIQTITREEIEDKVMKDGKATTEKPDWEKMKRIISGKYQGIDVNHLVLDYQINYYRNVHLNWRLWAKYKSEMFDMYPPKAPYGLHIYMDFNAGGAWEAFLHCPDTLVLRKALEWIDRAIALEGDQANYLDTKANLLYKLGRKEEALSLEKEAVDADPKDEEKVDAYRKMRRGEPTWPRPIVAYNRK